MKRITSTLVTAALAAGAGVGLLAAADGAAATGTAPPWVNSTTGQSTDAAGVGGLAFFDSSGNQVTSGRTDTAPFAPYVAGLKTLRANDTKSFMLVFTPEVGNNPAAWSKSQPLGASSTFPNASAPSPVKDTALPVYAGGSSDLLLDDQAGTYPAASTSGYANVYEVRLYTNKPGSVATTTYDYADISINSATHTWSLVYTPDAPSGTATTSTLVANKTSVNQGDTVHLTDTVAPTGATGTVQFRDSTGGAPTNVGSPVAVSGGKAETDVIVSASGAHAYTAVFTPAALSAYSGSTSNAVTVTAAKVVANTSVALSVNPTTGPAYSNVTLTGTVTPAVAGTVKFADGGAQIGQAAVTASNNVAAISYNGFAEGTHHLTATFTPTNTSDYNSGTSAVVDHVATAAQGATPDDQPLTVDVGPGSLAITTPYTVDHPLDVGTLRLSDDGTLLTVSKAFGANSFASYAKDTNGKPVPDGTGSIQVVDTRAGNGNWTASAQSRDLGNDSGGVIDSHNIGLTNLKAVVVSGNALTAGSLVFTDNPAAAGVAPGTSPATGTAQGLGGQPHEIAHTVNGGNGSIGMYGDLTINAPTSTKAGHYTGIITFTVMGSTAV